MTFPPRNPWIPAALLWIAVIFFYSTSVAGRWSGKAFDTIARCFHLLRLNTASHQLLHFAAEKSVHICLFLVLAAILSRALPKQHRKFGLILLIGLAVGSMSEFLQRFFPGRGPALRDVCINVAGTALGAVLSLVVLKPPVPLLLPVYPAEPDD